MKKILLLSICFMCFMCFMGCNGSKSVQTNKQEEKLKVEKPKVFCKVKTKHLKGEEQTLDYFVNTNLKIAEDDIHKISIYFTGLFYNESSEIVGLEFENKNPKFNAMARVKGVIVNGYTIDSSMHTEILKNTKAKDDLCISSASLEKNGLTMETKEAMNIKDINIIFEVVLEGIVEKEYNITIYPIKENWKFEK